MSGVRCPFALGRLRIGSFNHAAFNVCNASSLVLSEEGNLAGWSCRDCLYSGAAILAKFSKENSNNFS